jgi:hypothetical protein
VTIVNGFESRLPYARSRIGSGSARHQIDRQLNAHDALQPREHGVAVRFALLSVHDNVHDSRF